MDCREGGTDQIEIDAEGASKMGSQEEEPEPQDSRKRRRRDTRNVNTGKEKLDRAQASNEGEGLRSSRYAQKD